MNSGDMMENKELLDDIRAGKSSTIKEVYKTYVSDVFGFTKSITGDDESAMTATKAKTEMETFLVSKSVGQVILCSSSLEALA